MSSTSASTATTPNPGGGSSRVLGPAWYRGGGTHGSRGFQPPPAVSSDRGEENGKDEDGFQHVGKGKNRSGSFSSRSEGLLSSGGGGSGRGSSYSRTSSGGSFGKKPTGRSLADLVASKPNTGMSRSQSGGAPYRERSASTTTEEVDKKPVIRYTREKLLSLRPQPADGLPAYLKHLLGTVVLSNTPQEPVCFDDFDADEIWAQPTRGPRPTVPKPRNEDGNRQNNGGGGRWQRGVALPTDKRSEDASAREDLWDDPVSTTEDLSQYGGPIDDLRRSRENSVTSANSDKFDLADISEAASRFDKEIHGDNVVAEDVEDNGHVSKPVDPHKPLASAGTTILSGSGEDVNVFEDFGDPVASEPSSPPSEAKEEKEELSASSRLMQMIGMPVPDESKLMSSWTGGSNDSPEISSFGNVGGFIDAAPASSVPKNPWGSAFGGTLGGTALLPSETLSSDVGFDLAARLEAAVQEQKAREAKAEEERRRESERQELLRRQKEEEEEAQRIQALLRAQMSAQHAARQAEAQRQATRVQYNSQVEAILIERTSAILEKSWGRADLMNILSALHMDDSRVIPLLGSIDSLKALLARHPQRFALTKEPQYGVDVAILILSNAQWNQKVEEMQRQHLQAQAAAQAQVEKVTNAPWFYADPQGNIQGPFGGEEMRQWLDAGYFKGDLPVSQNPTGPFRSLLSIFPDPSVAFHVNQSPVEDKKETKTPEPEKEEVPITVKEPEPVESPQPEITNSLSVIPSSDQNASSVQLKMLLGLGGTTKPQQNEAKIETPPTEETEPIVVEEPPKEEKEEPPSEATEPKPKKSSKKKAPKPPSPTPVLPPAPAWGGVAANKTTRKKTMSEIQQEEARVSAILAKERSLSRSSSSGWANVAASGGGPSGWTSGAVKTPVVIAAAPQAKVKQTKEKQKDKTSQNKAVDDFGASMTPALEGWCKEKMLKLTGSDDLTLLSFCMTLNDPVEIRQYLAAYLGSTPEVSNFANEFIHRKGGSKASQEEWESADKAKKSRKKKPTK